MMIFRTCLCVLAVLNLTSAQKIIKFGAFFDVDDVESLAVFEIAVSRQNIFNVQFRLEPIIKKIAPVDGFEAQRAVCEMVDQGAVAIVGPKSIYVSDVVASICNELNIPHLVHYHRVTGISRNEYHKFTRNIHPDTTLISNALVDVIKNYRWTKFAIIYDSDESLIRLNGILQMFPSGHGAVSVYKFPGMNQIKQLLKDIKKSHEHRVIIDCNIEGVAEIVRQGLTIGMMDEYISYFITMPDGHMLDIPELKSVKSNFTTIRLMTPEDVEAKNIIEKWKETKKYLNSAQSRFAEEVVAPNRLKLELALVRDVITVLASALSQEKLYQRIGEPTTRCEIMDYPNSPSQYWKNGRDLLRNIHNKFANGITGPIRFIPYYKTREDIYLDLVELKRNQGIFGKVARWNKFEELVVTKSQELIISERKANMQSKVFKVITKLGMPFLEEITNSTKVLVGNQRYQGFVKDLMDGIARVKNFSYELIVVEGDHISYHDPHTGRMMGIVAELLNSNADFGICDFTITHERKQLIDFSNHFMTLGISILFKKPEKKDPDWFNFLKPFESSVWLYISTAFLCVSISVYILAKITKPDWEKPHPCEEEPEELENIWNMHNSIWLAAGSFMQQGCDILPKGLPTRLTTAAWWFFVVIVIGSYTANMAAFLTKEQMEETIESTEDLAKETTIKYGLMRGGSTETFFKESNMSLYQKMWAAMEHDPSVFVENNNEGIKRVLGGKYAFLMESATIEYELQRECTLRSVGEWLDSKSYGIGMPKHSPYRDDINEALLKLMEDRSVQGWKEKWWLELNHKIDADGSKKPQCHLQTEEKSDLPALNFLHIRGLCLVLLCGILLSIFVGILEFLWNVRKVSVTRKITPYEVLRSELRFACKVWITQKPVLGSQSASLSSINSVKK